VLLLLVGTRDRKEVHGREDHSTKWSQDFMVLKTLLLQIPKDVKLRNSSTALLGR
jgi:hypothetical protein